MGDKINWKLNPLNGKNEEGFTLLEVLAALSIMSLSFLLLSIFTEQASRIQDEIKADRQIEWHLFLNQLEYDLSDGRLKSIHRDEFSAEKPAEDGQSETITYERYYTLLRRKVEGKGHQPVLTKLQSIRFEEKEAGLLITAIFQNDDQYQAELKIQSR